VGFEDGAIVRLKSGGPAMTVSWTQIKGGHEVVGCTFEDSEGKPQFRELGPLLLERVPDKALQRLQKQKDMVGFKAQLENHPVMILGSFVIASFVLGASAVGAIIHFSNQDLVAKTTYTLNADVQKTLSERYVDKRQYDGLSVENQNLRTELAKVAKTGRTDIQNEAAEIERKRDALWKSLPAIRERNNISFYFSDKPEPVSREEQDALDQIDQYNKELLILDSKILP